MAKLLLFSDFSKITEIVCGGAYLDKWHTAKLSLLWHATHLRKEKPAQAKCGLSQPFYTQGLAPASNNLFTLKKISNDTYRHKHTQLELW